MVKTTHKIKKIYFRGERFYITISDDEGKQKTFPRANYNWLKGNPSFEEIPKGYVIHHLDGDKLNDDISNLVIMQKHHHAAHHWKNKTILPKIEVRFSPIPGDLREYIPLKEPTIHWNKAKNR